MNFVMGQGGYRSSGAVKGQQPFNRQPGSHFPRLMTVIFKTFFLKTLLLTLYLDTADSSNLRILRTFQVHACDGDDLIIECYPNTIININLAQYGRQVPSHQLCPPVAPNSGMGSDDHFSPENDTTNCVANETLRYTILQTVEAACREQRTCKVKTSPDSFGGDPCPGVRKYAEVAYKCRPNSFHNKIVCEGERLILRCAKAQRIVIYSAAFGGTRYEVDTSYCPNPEGVKNQEDCQVSYATETVMSSCHGKRKCSVGADLGTFGSPGCPKGVRLHLKVVYTCVPKEILKELDLGKGGASQSSDFGDETKEQSEADGDYPALVDENQSLVPSSTYSTHGGLSEFSPPQPPVLPPGFQPPKKVTDLEYGGATDSKGGTVHSKVSHIFPPTTKAPGESRDSLGSVGGTSSTNGGASLDGRARLKPTIKTDMQSDENLDGELSDSNCTEEQRVIGFITEWVKAFNYVKKNKEKFILYLTVSLSAGLVAFLIVLAGRLYIQKRRDRPRASKMRISEPLTSPYGGDDMAELDAAFEATERLTTTALTGTSPLSGSACEPEVVRYTNSRNTMRRQDSDTHPRAPVARNMNNYYYS